MKTIALSIPIQTLLAKAQCGYAGDVRLDLAVSFQLQAHAGRPRTESGVPNGERPAP